MIKLNMFQKDKYFKSRIDWKEIDRIQEKKITDRVLNLFKRKILVKNIKKRNAKLINSEIFLITDHIGHKTVLSKRKNPCKKNKLILEEVEYNSYFYSLVSYIEGDHFDGSLSHLNILSQNLPSQFLSSSVNIEKNSEINYEKAIEGANNFFNFYGAKFLKILQDNSAYNNNTNLKFLNEVKNNPSSISIKYNNIKLPLNIDLHPHNIIINRRKKSVSIIDNDTCYLVYPEIAIGFHLFKIIRHSLSKVKNHEKGHLYNIIDSYIKKINILLADKGINFKLTELIEAGLVEIYRRIIFIIDQYTDMNRKEWLSDISMHCLAYFENRYIKDTIKNIL